MRKPAFCICENKGAEQLPSNPAADQCLSFHYIGQSLSLLNSNFKASSYLLLAVRPSLCWTWSGTPEYRLSCNVAHICKIHFFENVSMMQRLD